MMVKTSTGSANNNTPKYAQVNKKQNKTNPHQASSQDNNLRRDQLLLNNSSREVFYHDNNNNNNQTLQFIDNQEHHSHLSDTQTENSNTRRQVLEDLEEVYICNCCGISKELNPSIKYMSTYKCIFFVFNFLVFAFGLANFGMGLWFRIDPKVYEIHKYIETQNFTNAGWLLLFCGFLACLISFIGFIGAAKQAIIYGLGTSLEQFMVKEVYEQLRRRTMNTEDSPFQGNDAVQFMDFIQVKMRCCGATDFRDYLKLGMTIPTTCYTIDKNYISAPGCGHAIRQLLDLRVGLATGFTLGSLIAQLLTIISSALIFCSIYHYRAIPRASNIAMSSQAADSFSSDVITQSPIVYQEQQQLPRTVHSLSRDPSPIFERVQNNKIHLQRPRSRTPIII